MEPYSITGPLIFSTAMDVVLALHAHFAMHEPAPSEPITVDLSQITEIDSSALAVLLSIKRLGTRLKTEAKFLNSPLNLHSLAELYNISDVLAIQP